MTLKLRILRSLTRLFIILVSHYLVKKMCISNRCIGGLMSNLIKKSWTDSNMAPLCLIKIYWTENPYNLSIKYVAGYVWRTLNCYLCASNPTNPGFFQLLSIPGISAKGQLISKCLFGIFNSSERQNTVC